MATPDFVLALRSAIGTDPLWLSGVTAVITRGAELLLVRRADTLEWTPVTGVIDPGEHPASAAVREAKEEADIEIRVDRLASVGVSEQIIYGNGDQAQYLDLTFYCRWVSGEVFPADGENVAAAWFPLEELPTIPDRYRHRIRAALSDETATRFIV